MIGTYMNKAFSLYTGSRIPSVGYGTCNFTNLGEVPKDAVKELLTYAVDNVGYRHLDCAHVYQNEKEIGEALKALKTSRSELFITSKLWNTFHKPEDVEKGLEITLKDLQVEYLDLYLMHWPCAFVSGEGLFPKNSKDEAKFEDIDYLSTWKAMEKLLDTGKVKHIGVSNFTVKKLERLLSECKVKPAVNQVEMHPYLTQPELYEFCQKNQIHVTAYSPLGSSLNKLNLLGDEKVEEIAKKHKTTSGTILISWAAQRTSVIPRSSKKERIKSNFEVMELPKEDVEQINKLNKNARCISGFSDVFHD